MLNLSCHGIAAKIKVIYKNFLLFAMGGLGIFFLEQKADLNGSNVAKDL